MGGNQQEVKKSFRRVQTFCILRRSAENLEKVILSRAGRAAMRLNKFNIQSPTIITAKIADKLCDFDIFCLKYQRPNSNLFFGCVNGGSS